MSVSASRPRRRRAAVRRTPILRCAVRSPRGDRSSAPTRNTGDRAAGRLATRVRHPSPRALVSRQTRSYRTCARRQCDRRMSRSPVRARSAGRARTRRRLRPSGSRDAAGPRRVSARDRSSGNRRCRARGGRTGTGRSAATRARASPSRFGVRARSAPEVPRWAARVVSRVTSRTETAGGLESQAANAAPQ